MVWEEAKKRRAKKRKLPPCLERELCVCMRERVCVCEILIELKSGNGKEDLSGPRRHLICRFAACCHRRHLRQFR